MNTQVICNTEAYVVTELDSNESWLLARVELCNGTFCIIKGRETRLYTTRRRFEQAWSAIMKLIKDNGWDKIIA